VEALPSLPKAIWSSLVAGLNAVWSGCQARPKTLPKRATSLGPAVKQHPIVLGLPEPNPKHFKKRLGLTASQTHRSWGMAAQLYQRILLFIF